MRQHSNLAKDPAEKVVKDIRRATRKQYSAEEKALKEVVADLTLENRLLKKSVTADGEDEA